MSRRNALDKLAAFYKTQLGQDVIETGLGATTAALGQLLLTDMTLAEIAGSTALGVGAAAVGRPLVGRAGQAIGSRLDRNPQFRQGSGQLLQETKDVFGKTGPMREAIDARFAPYAHLSPSAQFGQFYGRGYGDNIMQALVALSTPAVLGGGEEE